MKKEEFDVTETIAGFPLLSIRRALLFVGLIPDRDDIQIIAEGLGCPPRQAANVLEALERRGLVTKLPQKGQWEVTTLGRHLRFSWKPPRRLTPVIERDDDSDSINEGFETVWCSLLRTSGDDSAMLEEAQFDVSVFVDHETDRVIEVSVVQPDDYDYPDSSATIDTSVYLDVTEAKKFVKGMQAAIERAEEVLKRRASAKPRRRPKAQAHAASNKGPSKAEVAAAKAAALAEKKAQERKKRESAALASTVAELQRGRKD